MLDRLNAILRNRKENDKGFSLVELAVVIVIIGILVAVAIPVFMGMQAAATTAAQETAVANGAAMVATEVATGETAQAAIQTVVRDAVGTEHAAITVSTDPANAAVSLDNYCVALGDIEKGPGC